MGKDLEWSFNAQDSAHKKELPSPDRSWGLKNSYLGEKYPSDELDLNMEASTTRNTEVKCIYSTERKTSRYVKGSQPQDDTLPATLATSKALATIRKTRLVGNSVYCKYQLGKGSLPKGKLECKSRNTPREKQQ